MRARAFPAGAILLLMLLAACQPTKTPDHPPSAVGFAVDGAVTPEALAEITAATGLRPRYVVLFLAWAEGDRDTAFPVQSLGAATEAGAVPVLTWEPWVIAGETRTPVLAADVLAGKWDAYLTAFAQQAKAFSEPIWIRFAHEMNFEQYHWGVERTGYGPEAPFLYRDLWRHVVDIFRREGAENVKWVFCPNAESVPNPDRDPAAAWNRASRYYPGDDYVDVLGMDGYNWGDTLAAPDGSWRSRWQSFAEIFEPLHTELQRLAPDKPILVFETASVSAGGDKAAWITDAWRTARAWGLDAVCWFQVNKENDWRFQSGLDPAEREAIVHEIQPRE